MYRGRATSFFHHFEVSLVTCLIALANLATQRVQAIQYCASNGLHVEPKKSRDFCN